MKTSFLCLILLCFNGILFAQTQTWSTLVDTSTTFSSPRTVHLNGDGVLDIVMGGGLDGDPQSNGVVAIDGATGTKLWSFHTNEEIFASAKFQDISGDGIDDIFIGGRYAEFYAINGATGAQIWEFFPHPPTSSVDSGWFNFYSPQWIPDQNADGKMDILVTNGGNHSLPSWITNRDPGLLMVLDAATGAVLAKDTMPDGEETYCSPVAYDFNGTGLEIIFGSGGEDDGGSLWRVSLADLMSNDISNATSLATHATRGFIAPPSLADMNGDGVLDIINQAYDGTIRVFNGVDNSPIWTSNNPGTESSAAPTIGNFTGDITPDVFVVLAKGHAPSFSDYYQVLIDGATGQTIWKDSISQLHFSSSGAFDMNMDGRDEVLMSLNYHTGSFKHQLLYIDFENNLTAPFFSQEGGVNLGSSPLIEDIDSNGYLDVIYAFRADSMNPMGQNGFRVARLETNYTVPGVGVAWGSYMGTNADGIYNYQGTACGTIVPNFNIANISCNGMGDGVVIANPTGGVGPYTYLWETGSIADSIGGNDVGFVNVRITDSTGCYLDDSVAFSDPYTIQFGGLNLPTCQGDSNAVITVNSSGCPCMFSGCIFTWSNNGSTTKVGAGLWAGWQYVTITHLDGCVVVDSTLIPNPPPIINSATVKNIPCYDYSGGKGEINLTLTNPGNTSVLWSNGKPTPLIDNLDTGTYSVVVNTTTGCVDSAEYTITIPDTLVINESWMNPACNNDSTGQITLSPTGGTAPYSYIWNNGDSTATLTGLEPGAYVAGIVDSLGCVSVIDTIFLTNPDSFVISNVQAMDLNCAGDSSGAISVSSTGAQGPITYLWSSGHNSQNLNNIVAGYYNVILTDSAGCSVTIDSIQIEEPDSIIATLQATDALVGCNGTASVTPSGGLPSYSFEWSNSETTANISGLCAGTYAVTITDSNGCTYMDSVVVSMGTNVGQLQDDNTALVMYPNPTQGTLILEGNMLENRIEISILNALGQEVKRFEPTTLNNKLNLDVHELIPGCYNLVLRTNGTFIKARKFLKQ